MITYARRLPPHHVTIRVPWHDGGWTGTVCARPLDNSSCLILPRIGEGPARRSRNTLRRPAARRARPGRTATLHSRARLVHGSLRCPTSDDAPLHEDFPRGPTAHFGNPPALCSQSTLLLACPSDGCCARNVEGSPKDVEIGIAERLKIGWVPDREPDIRNYQGKTGRDSLGPGARKPARSTRHLLRRATAKGIALLLLCQAHPPFRAVPTRDRRRGPRALRGRRHRVRIQS